MLERECRIFTRYIAGRDPTAYVIKKYSDAHAACETFAGDRFDDCLIGVARLHPACTLIADAYARLLAPHSAFRKKLILLLAILEVSPPFFRELDRPAKESIAPQAMKIGLRIVALIPAVIFGVLLFLPISLITRKNHQ
jgi:hypothetical protein